MATLWNKKSESQESIAKGPTIFENPADIERKLKKLLAQLKDESFLKQTTEQDFLPRLAHYFAELNSPIPRGKWQSYTRVCSSALTGEWTCRRLVCSESR